VLPELVSTLETPESLERRHASRNNAEGPAKFIDRFGRAIVVELVDLSEDGVGVWSSEPAECGSLVTIALPARRSYKRIQLSAKVVECLVTAPGLWRIGFLFDRRLDALELAAALP